MSKTLPLTGERRSRHRGEQEMSSRILLSHPRRYRCCRRDATVRECDCRSFPEKQHQLLAQLQLPSASWQGREQQAVEPWSGC